MIEPRYILNGTDAQLETDRASPRHCGIPEEMERLAGVLDALEAAWAPLRELAPHETEPAVAYRVSRQETRA